MKYPTFLPIILSPDLWKSSFIKPILKSGNRSNLKNCKLISINSVIFKLFRNYYHLKLTHYLKNNSTFIQQHGF